MNSAASRKLAYLTAGAGGMYCGSCMHDNALAAAMKQHGAQVDLIPVYTPIRTDEQTYTIDHVFFGGINVFLQQKLALFRYLPGWLDRVLDRPGLIRRATAQTVGANPKLLGELTISMLRGEKGFQRKEVYRLNRYLQQVVQPQVLLLTNILIGGGIATWKRTLQAPVYVILQGDDVFLDYLPEEYEKEAVELIREIAVHVDGFLVHSQHYAELIAKRLRIEPAKLTVTPLGINTDDFQTVTAVRDPARRTIGYLARLAPEKGLQHLVEAFLQLKRNPAMADVRLEIAGWLGEDHRPFAEAQFQRLRDAGLSQAFHYHGIVDRDQKIRFLARIDLLCVPTDFVEPKGLYALEALACGAPVLLPDHGAFSELIQASCGGWLVEPRNSARLAEALAERLADRDSLRQAGARGRDYVLRERSTRVTSQRVLERLGLS